ncbi:MAG: hypothetical protein M0041_00030 [Nitrospiraceae bacterium]|nr:hypothetical protein [Nitrospiraceae bacterium]
MEDLLPDLGVDPRRRDRHEPPGECPKGDHDGTRTRDGVKGV